MKKTLLSLIIVLLLSVNLFSQTTTTRQVFFQSYTSSTCGPCASANPYMAAFLATKGDTVVGIKYHMNWPSPGNDPMYLHNPTENTARRTDYGVNSIPYTRVDGLTYTQTYTNSTLLNNYVVARLMVPTPIAMSVVDQRLPGDTVKTTITVTNLSALPNGTYFLKVDVSEKEIRYETAPGTNGEIAFPHVFRKSIPSTAGTSHPTAAGTYTYVFKYYLNPAWVKNQIYTIAFVQESASKEIMNVAGKWTPPNAIVPVSTEIPKDFSVSQNYPNPFNPSTTIEFGIPEKNYTTMKIYNVLGKEVGTYHSGVTEAGKYKIVIDASTWSSGMYFYTITSGKYSVTKKLMVVK